MEHYYGNTYPKKSAFIDPSGRVVAIFDNISCYSHKGFYEVRGPNGYGIYNANLQKIEVPLKYEDISEDGADVNLFPAKKNGKWGYVSGGGVESIGFRFKNAYSFDPDTKLACVKDEVYADKYGYIDVSGNYKILPQYDSAGKMTRCGARVMRSNGDVSEYGYITTSGKIITSWYPYMGNRFVLDRIFVRDSEGLGGFIDKNDKLVIPYQFEETEPVFNEITHLAKVRFKGMDWYINTNGAFAIPESIYVFKPDKSDGRHRETDRKTNGKTGRTVAEKVAPTEQSIPDLIVKIADSFESAELESSNDNGKESEIPRWSKHDGKESEAPRGSRW